MTDAPLVRPGETNESITETISSITLRKHARKGWFLGFLGVLTIVLMFFYAIGYLLVRGVGIWGINIPVAWGFAITNFVWWIGIGHAGTLISAILLLLHQEWRNSINRFAEAMTIFAVACAGMFPLLHLGRPWLFYWMTPYPDTMSLWPQFRSPLVWDLFAVFTYLTVSLIFWFLGMVPDFATLRDRTHGAITRWVYGVLALGWRGDLEHWDRYRKAYLLLAGLATPLVVSVHSVVSFDFAVAQVPGWHSTIFPPYFVAGAIFSGFAMVLTIAIPLRWMFPEIKAYVTEKHLDNCAKVMLATELVLAYGYFNEFFLGWYSDDLYEKAHILHDAFGTYAAFFWLMIVCNILIPQLLWIRFFRIKPVWLLLISIVVNVGMWTERFVIIVPSLAKDFVPAAWGYFSGTVWDWATFIGSLGFFTACYFLFIRFLPMMSMSEVRELAQEERER
ncbi:MAG TPA: NrfD/PsrC family molybdoenzyme membrane anchor subunit [Thermoanaerobaculia bacterium]|nr:NrfD/PsrC family molybdoenzyme membrane anchor subunit [Thermoanaerobaculia bacterium]